MANDGALQKLLAKLEEPSVAWGLVAVGVIILVKLKLVLFACALPLVVYWRLSQASTATEEADDQEPTSPTEKAGLSQWNVGDQEDDQDLSPGVSGPPSEVDDDIFGEDPAGKEKKGGDESPDPYDSSFWGDTGAGEGSAPGASAPAPAAPKEEFNLREKGSWGAVADSDDELAVPGPVDPLDPDPLAEYAAPKEDNILEGLLGSADLPGRGGGGGPDFGLGSLGFGKDDDDFPSLGGPMMGMEDDDRYGGGFGGGFGGGGKGGKGKGKGKKGEGKGKDGPREADPKQLFVANVGDLSQGELRDFFEEVGEVTRLKVLEKEDGSSKGVCFVTFATEEQARDALRLHGKPFGERNLVVRLAQAGGGKGEKGEKGEKGGGKHHDRDRFDRDHDRDRGDHREDREFSERFGSAFGDRGDRDNRGKGKGGGGKGGNRHRHDPFREVEGLIQNALDDGEAGALQLSDFDFSKKFLLEIHNRDKADGSDRFSEAMDMVLKYAGSKDRSSVRKWPAYVLTLLTRFDPDLAEDLRRDGKGDGGRHKGGGKGHRDRDD